MLMLNLEQLALRGVAHIAGKYTTASMAEGEAYVAKKRALYQRSMASACVAKTLDYDAFLVYEDTHNQVDRVLSLLTEDLKEVYADTVSYTNHLIGAIRDGKDFDPERYLFGKGERDEQLAQLWREIQLMETERQLDRAKMLENHPDGFAEAAANYNNAAVKLHVINKEYKRLHLKKNILQAELKTMQDVHGAISMVAQKKLLENEIKNNFRQKKSLKGFVNKLLSLRQGSDLIP